MALERGKLSNVVRVAAGTTVGIITCASSKKVYIKSGKIEEGNWFNGEYEA